ncbi:MAG: hypothetical protein EHM46_06930 [Bacteroidetes bacterium]|nr:MAG: hypothetical protein EHM46_06930 [Bacteroidota bacterium]
MAILSVLFLLVISCGEKVFTENVDCAACYSPEPDTAYLYVDLTINKDFPEVPLVLYRGDVEQADIDYVDTAYASPYRVAVAVDQKYSVKAKYRKDDRTLYAIGGTRIKILLVTATCDQDCYVVKNDRINVKIRDEFLDF